MFAPQQFSRRHPHSLICADATTRAPASWAGRRHAKSRAGSRCNVQRSRGQENGFLVKVLGAERQGWHTTEGAPSRRVIGALGGQAWRLPVPILDRQRCGVSGTAKYFVPS